MPAKSGLSALPYSAPESLWGPRRSECRCGRVPDGLVKQSTPAGLDPPLLTDHTSNRLTTQPLWRVPWKRRGSLPAFPLRQRRQGSGRAAVSAWRTFRCDAVLAASATAGLGRGVPRLPRDGVFGARPTAPCCEIRFLVLHTYPVALGLLRSSWHQGLWP